MTVTSIPMDLQYDDELGMKKWVDEMIEMRNEKIAILMIVLMLLSGCTGSDSGGGSDVQDEVDGSMDPVEGENETDSGDSVPLVISVPHSVGCDSLGTATNQTSASLEKTSIFYFFWTAQQVMYSPCL